MDNNQHPSFGSLAIQWNMRGYRANYGELVGLLRDFTPMVICLQETILGAHIPSPPNSYKASYLSPGIDPRPGTGLATLMHRSVASTPIPLQTTLQAQAHRVGLAQPITICNIYLSQNDNVTHAALAGLIQQLPAPFLLLGDFNAKHPMWGCDVTDARGKVIADLLLSDDVALLNTGQPTHFHLQTNSLSAIDLSLCSPTILPNLIWQTLDDPNGSDHFPIIIDTLPYRYKFRTTLHSP